MPADLALAGAASRRELGGGASVDVVLAVEAAALSAPTVAAPATEAAALAAVTVGVAPGAALGAETVALAATTGVAVAAELGAAAPADTSADGTVDGVRSLFAAAGA